MFSAGHHDKVDGICEKSRLLGSLTLSVEYSSHWFTHVSRGDSRLSDMFPPTLKDGRGISPRGNFSRLTGNATIIDIDYVYTSLVKPF